MKLFRSLGIGNSSPAFLLVVTIVMLLALSFSAAAQNQYYVSTNGNDAGNGTSGNPWATCNHAVATATIGSPGAVINFIASSTQHAACSSINRGGSSTTARLVLRCTAPWTASTHCRMAGAFVVNAANNVDIGASPQLGFEYTNPSDGSAVDVVGQCATDSGACGWGNSIHVIGNYFHDIGQTSNGGCPASGAILITNRHGVSVTDAQVIGNVVDHFGTYPNSSCHESQGIYISTQGGQVYNNIVTRIPLGGLQYYDQGCNARISNNVFANNGIGIILYGDRGCTPGLNTVDNNIIVNNSSAGVYTGGSAPADCSTGWNTQFSNNDMFGNGTNFNLAQPSCESRLNQRAENPTATFVNYTGTASGDYHLKSGSIAIAAGTTRCAAGSQCVPAFDLAATARPGTPSIGIYESGDASSPSLSAPTGLTATVQ